MEFRGRRADLPPIDEEVQNTKRIHSFALGSEVSSGEALANVRDLIDGVLSKISRALSLYKGAKHSPEVREAKKAIKEMKTTLKELKRQLSNETFRLTAEYYE